MVSSCFARTISLKFLSIRFVPCTNTFVRILIELVRAFARTLVFTKLSLILVLRTNLFEDVLYIPRLCGDDELLLKVLELSSKDLQFEDEKHRIAKGILCQSNRIGWVCVASISSSVFNVPIGSSHTREHTGNWLQDKLINDGFILG